MSDSVENVVNNILVKLGQVFSRAGDAVFKDFTEACLGDGATWDDFKKKFDKDAVDAFEEFVNHVTESLGYDISNCKSGELYDLVKAVVVKSIKIGESVGEYIKKSNGKITLDSLLCINAVDQDEANKDKVLSLGEVVKLSGLPVNVEKYESKGIEVGGDIKAIFDLVSEIVDLIKKISDFEWKKLADDCEDFGKFIKDKYINEEFGRRVLDYILIILLKNAKDVFADDATYLLNAGSGKLKEILAPLLGDKANDVIGEVQSYVTKIADIDKYIKDLEDDLSENKDSGDKVSEDKNASSNNAVVATKSKKSMKRSAKTVSAMTKASTDETEVIEVEAEEIVASGDSQTSDDSAKKSKVQLQAGLDYCKKQLNSYLEKNIPSYNILARIFDKTYAILNLCGFIGTKSVNLIEIGAVKDANSEIKDKTSVDLIDLASDKIGTTIEIPVIHWEYIEQMFTKPKEYFKTAFPLENAEDVEKLVAKIAIVIRSFNADFPEFKNIKQFVLDIINRIDERLGNPVQKWVDGAKQALTDFKNYLVNLLKVLESYAIKARDALKASFNEFKEIASDAVAQSDNLVCKLKIEFSEFAKYVNENLKDLGQAEILKEIFYDTFENAAKDIIKDRYAGKGAEEILHLDFDALLKPLNTFTGSMETCGGNLKKLAEKIQKDFMDSFGLKGEFPNISIDENVWKDRFDKLVDKLEEKFTEQTKDVPKSLEQLEQFAYTSIADLAQGKGLNNPLSSFDPSAYFKIVGDAFSENFTIDFGAYFDDFGNELKGFKNSVRTFFDDFFKGLQSNVKGISEFGDDIQNLATDILAAWVENIKDAIYKLVLRPCIQFAKKAIKKWAATYVVPAVMELVRGAFNGNNENNEKIQLVAPNGGALKDEDVKVLKTDASTGESTMVVASAETVVNNIIDLLSFIQTVKEGAGSVNSLGDGIQFAIKLYQKVPKFVKDYVSELIDLPNLDDIVGNIHLPEYSLDVENKFFAVTLWKYKYNDGENKSEKETGNDTNQDADILIQLAVFVGEEGEGDNKTEGIYILPIVKGKYNIQFGLGKNHLMKFGATASLNKDSVAISSDQKNSDDKKLEDKLSGKEVESDDGKEKKKGKLGFFISRGEDGSGVKIKPLADEESVSAYLELGFERKKDKDGKPLTATLVDSDVVKLTIDNYPQKIFAGYSGDSKSFDVGFLTSLEGLNLALKLKHLNGFFDTILSDDINVDVGKLALSYSLDKGLRIEDKLHVKIPFNNNIDLKFVKFKDLTLDLGLENGDLEASLLTTFIADLKCVAFTFTDLGFGVKCNLFTPECKAGTLKLEPKIKYPSGIGISVDASAVKGTGGIQWDEEKERFAGFLELKVLEKFGVNAMLVFTTGNGSVPFSFMGALSVLFNPGIQVGMGFSITSIGGSLGLNRGLDIDNLRAAVYDGSLSSVLFVKDIKKDFDKVLANIDKYYPITEDQMYVGMLAQISWGTILSADFGLFIQAPSPITVVIAGLVKVRLADSAEKLIAINANFLGGIQFDKGFFFDASLFDSKLVGISIYGDMALRIYWGGDTKGFILSIGGFHPKYKPESGFNLVDMKRVGMKLDFGPVNMSLEAYFAITSNTVQFGSAFNMKVGWDKFGMTGHAIFNVLFQFKPFYFMADMSVGLAVKLGSTTLCSISLDFDLSGPAKWHAKGKAKISILFFDVSVKFSCTWGKNQSEIEQTPVDVYILFEKEYTEKSNWKIISTDWTDNLVTLLPSKDKEFVAQPSDLISFSQSKVPLNEKMDCYGDNRISDCSQINLSQLSVGSEIFDFEKQNGVEKEETAFSPSLTRKMSDEDKLTAESYVNKTSGFRLSANFGSACGNEEKKDFEEDKVVNDFDIGKQTVGEFVSQWEERFTKAKALNDKSSATVVSQKTVKKTVSTKSLQTNVLSNDIADAFKVSRRMPLKNVAEGGRSSLMSRSSLRRSSTGFKRYVKQIDELLKVKAVDDLMETSLSQNEGGMGPVSYNPEQFDSVVEKVVLNAPKLINGEKISFDYTVKEGDVTVEWVTYVRLRDNKYFINNQEHFLISDPEEYEAHVYLYPKKGFAFKEVDGNAVCEVVLADGTKLSSRGHMTANGKYCCHFSYRFLSLTERDIRYIGFHNKGAYNADFIISYKRTENENWIDKKIDWFAAGRGTDKCSNQYAYPNKLFDLRKANIPQGSLVTVKVKAQGGLGSGKAKRSLGVFRFHPEATRYAQYQSGGTSLSVKINNPETSTNLSQV